jgi:hypothetical protein
MQILARLAARGARARRLPAAGAAPTWRAASSDQGLTRHKAYTCNKHDTGWAKGALHCPTHTSTTMQPHSCNHYPRFGKRCLGGQHSLFASLFFISFLVSFLEDFPLFVLPSFLLRITLARPQALHLCIDEAKTVFTGRAGDILIRSEAAPSEGTTPPLAMGLRDGHPLASMPLAQAAAALPTRSVLSAMSQCVTIASGVTPTLRR